MELNINPLITQADTIAVDLTPVRELRRAQESKRVQEKGKSSQGQIWRGQQSLQQTAQRLQAAGRTVNRVEGLLHDTLKGLRSNMKAFEPPYATIRLLRTADEVAREIIGFARFDQQEIFPPLASPLKFEQKKAVKAYTGNSGSNPVNNLLTETNKRLRGPGGVLPTLGELSRTGVRDLESTDAALKGLRDSMTDSHARLTSARSGLGQPSIDYLA
ncbi:MAG TPA: hypothetical protein VNI20_00010 [Fimbriimonadaceae bacterium]|nr:hypothetical protein [Fimbriimonadaceae bacterium]